MTFDKYAVVKVKGSLAETYSIIWIDPSLPSEESVRTSQNLSEDSVRAQLRSVGCDDAKISLMIQLARDNPAS
jgi:hypothetical protein